MEKAMAQEFRCGTPPHTESQRAEIMRKLRINDGNRNACTDPIDNSIKTYKLVLEYAVKSDGMNTTQLPSPAELNQIKNFINSKYNPLGIYFIYYDFPFHCNNCDTPSSPGWVRSNPITNYTDFQDCLWGRLTVSGEGINSGYGNFETGKFWSKYSDHTTITHELGHALGLLHTFNLFSPSKPSINELIVQDNLSCSCNCKISGDLICDTQADPYDFANTGNWNGQMFSITAGIINLSNIKDHCNVLYSNNNINHIDLMSNIMSYHNAGVAGAPSFIFSQGQGSYIKTWNQGKPWEIGGFSSSGGSMQPGFVVNNPTTISSPLNITGDIVINSTLTINNTSISFMKGNKIILNPGGHLILNNGHLGPFGGMDCLPQALEWEGIKVLQTGLSRVTMNNGSTINGAKIALESKGVTLFANIRQGSQINSFFNAAIDIDGGKGIVEVTGGSVLNGSITIKDFYSGLRLSSSIVNTPQFIGGGPISKISIKNATVSIVNDSKINSAIDVYNDGAHSVNLRNSTFGRRVFLERVLGKAVIRENTFIDFGSNLIVKNSINIDLYKNTFAGERGVLIDGVDATKPLVFKNIFTNYIYSLRNDHIASNARLECNNFIGQGSKDIDLIEPIARSQGNLNLAAGNSFSRTPNLEVNYLERPIIKYYFHDKGDEEPINIYTEYNDVFIKTKLEPNIPSTCSLPYPDTPPIPLHCKNGRKDGDETGIDCGGSCPPCVDIVIVVQHAHCTNGVLDAGETGIDCGGPCPPCLASCSNGVQDNGEHGIDCGGPCPPCPFSPLSCTDGIMNGNETGVDCGGPTCPPCDTTLCNNGILDNGETGVDCGGPCGPCITPPPAHCSNGIHDADETGVDCGGSCAPCPPPTHCNNGIWDGDESGIDCGGSCPPCTVIVYPTHCYNGVQDGNETGVDCGGVCPPCVVVYPPHCFNGKKDGNESGVDCGGSCPPCGYTSGGGSEGGPSGAGSPGRYIKGDHTTFINQLNAIYGTGFMNSNRYKVVEDFKLHQTTLDGGNSCAAQQYIIDNSASQPHKVIEYLTLLSPNVSANTMHILFAHSQYYTSAQVTSLLALNPAVISDRYISDIIYSTPTFSVAEKSTILLAAGTPNTRSNTETMLDYKKQYQDAIIRDNIAMISHNQPIDFDAIRAELATDPDPHKVFDIALTYADQGRHDLAALALTQTDLCEITDPLYRNQRNALINLYSNWINFQSSSSANRNDIVQQYLTQEHGLATDLTAQVTKQVIKLKERWRYEPLVFVTPSSIKDVSPLNIVVYPNPAYDVLNIHIRDHKKGNGMIANIINTDGKVVAEINIQSELNSLDISTLNSGVYSVKVMEQNQVVFVSKFIKIK